MSDGTDFVALAVRGLTHTSVYVDDTASLSQQAQVESLYNAHHVAVVVVPGVATSTVGPQGLAQQVLDATHGTFTAVVVVVDGQRDSFGVAGVGAEQIATTLNAANTGDAGETLVRSAEAVYASSQAAVTTTQVPRSEEAGASGTVMGGLLAAVVLIALFRMGRRRRRAAAPGSGPAQPQPSPSSLSLSSSLSSSSSPGQGLPPPAVEPASPRRSGSGDFQVTFETSRPSSSSEIARDVEAWYAAGRARGGVGAFGLAAVVGDARDILRRWDQIAGTPAEVEVRRLLLDHVPATLRAYYEIPAEQRDTATAWRPSPTQTVQEQMTLIAGALEQIRAAIHTHGVDGLDVEAVFLRSKFERNAARLRQP